MSSTLLTVIGIFVGISITVVGGLLAVKNTSYHAGYRDGFSAGANLPEWDGKTEKLKWLQKYGNPTPLTWFTDEPEEEFPTWCAWHSDYLLFCCHSRWSGGWFWFIDSWTNGARVLHYRRVPGTPETYTTLEEAQSDCMKAFLNTPLI